MPSLPRPLRYVIAFTVLFAALSHARAGTIHKLRFQQPAVLVVWQDGALVGQGAQVTLGPVVSTPLPGSGQLAPVLVGSTPVTNQMQLSVASNASFRIETPDTSIAAAIQVSVVEIGANAQNGARSVSPAETGEFGRILFAHQGKTARTRGAPESQAISLELSWVGDTQPALILYAY